MGRKAPVWLVALLVLPAALAGCLGSEEDPTNPTEGEEASTDWRFTDFIVTEHDHEDPVAHTASSPTMEHVAWDQLNDEHAESYIGELDTQAGLTAVAVLGQGSVPGFVLLDTSDPSQPERLGRGEAPAAYAVDVKLTEDGQFAMLATQKVTTSRVSGEPTQETVTEGTYAMRNGIILYDISDPTNPEIVSFAPAEAFGCHMLSIAQIEGTEWVFCINQSLTVYRFERSPEPQLVQAGIFWPFGEQGYDTLTSKATPLGATPHDMTFQLDPLTETPVLTVSHWDLGVAVLDVSNPLAPEQLLRWAGEGAEHYQGYLHSAMLTSLDGERYLVATPETLDDILPAIWVLDASDWAQPELVAEWVNPGGHTSQGLIMTVHQVQLVEDRIYMTYNHNGVWVLSLSTILEHGGTAPDASEVLGYHYPPVADLDVTFFDRESFPMGRPAVWDLNVV
ncbi:MAG: hypothetical protein R3185_05130, partial [Candidatus Thermoplasmatota archaeon]|nr:hypothetical protein [Candidatus Thermoplasmatota archaeon]